MKTAAFAIPGDMHQRTGGYIYEKSLLMALRAAGRTVHHVQLPSSFPDPSPVGMEETVETLAGLPVSEPLILDGLVYGAIETDGLARVRSPIIAMIHHPLGLETGLPEARARLLLDREKANLALASHVLVPSPHTARTLVSQFDVPEQRITVVTPGFEKSPAPRRPQAPPLILSVGLLAARKGHDVLLRALERIADLEWQAVIVGKTHDPEVERALRAQHSASNLGSRLLIAGEIGDDELASLYAGASVFALATRYEGYGIVFGEALVQGLPIVTCRTGAVPDTIPRGCGILVEVDDDIAFADALRRLLRDHDLRREMGRQSAAAGMALPTWQDSAAVAGRVIDRL
jgi:glycosyltransferase involved in cell wall biosynthesis